MFADDTNVSPAYMWGLFTCATNVTGRTGNSLYFFQNKNQLWQEISFYFYLG